MQSYAWGQKGFLPSVSAAKISSITPKLSLNYGIRWDMFTPSDEKRDVTSFTHDYPLLNGSPAIDGANQNYAQTAGKNGLTRGTPPDVGAHENTNY